MRLGGNKTYTEITIINARNSYTQIDGQPYNSVGIKPAQVERCRRKCVKEMAL